jgi:hypothetical protein
MIFSKDHNFLFIKNMKVGSTSMEVELSKILPDSAIVTLINPFNKEHRPRNMGKFVNHTTYLEASQSLDLSDVKSYTIVRHPYEMVLSDFFFRKEVLDQDWNSLTKPQQEMLVENYFGNQFSNGHWMKSTRHIYTINDQIAVTDILRHELGLENEINRILPIHNLPTIKFNTFEKAYRPNGIAYTDVFSKRYLDLIANEWSWEFMTLGYND